MNHEQIAEHHYEHPKSIEQIDKQELQRRRVAELMIRAGDNGVIKPRDAQLAENAAVEQLTGEFPTIEAQVTYDAGSDGPVHVNRHMN